ncbi:MAG: dipeptidase [Gemmatimonadales bacterium]
MAGACWTTGVLLSAGLAVGAIRPATGQTDAHRDRALRILRTTPLIDGHNDIPDAVRERGGLEAVDLARPQPRLQTDIARLRSGGVGAQFWAAYVPVSTMDSGAVPGPAVYALEQIDFIHRMCRRYGDVFAEARTAADVEGNFKAGKISCLIGIEGGHAIENSLGALRAFYELGVRYMTLTHWRTLDWADAATDTAKHGGLTPFGEAVVREMNRLGMLVDVSHVSDATMLDALRVTRAPVIYSHSSARAIAHHVRNVPDSVLRRVAANRGVVMVNFNPPFVSEPRRLHDVRRDSVLSRIRAAGADSAALADTLRAWNARAPVVTLSEVADHVDHIRRIAGVDCVGLGSDFDGISTVPRGLEDVGKFPDLLAELLRRGWSDQDIRKLVGLNLLRVLREAERVSAELGRAAARD